MKILDKIHNSLDKLIIKTVKKDIPQYEVEMIKAGVLLAIGVIFTLLAFIYSIVAKESFGLFDIYGFLALGCIPMSILYCMEILLVPFKVKRGASGFTFGIASAYFSGNIFMMVFGVVLDIVIYFFMVVVAVFIGLPVSLYRINSKIKNLKASTM